MNIDPSSAATPTRTQYLTGSFAKMTRAPFTKPHRLYFGEHLGSFPNQQAAVEAARQLSAGSAPGVVVTSHPAYGGIDFTPDDAYVEDSNFNVYVARDVQGPRITNPVIGWKDFNTVARDYHFGEPKGVLNIKGIRSTELMPELKGAVIIDGDKTVDILTRDS